MGKPLDDARQLAEWGFNVLPAKPGAAHPRVEWKRFQNERTDPMLDVWFRGSAQLDYWINTGTISQIVVLDCDNQAAIDYWTERLGAELLEATIAVKTKRGMHFYFRLTEPMASWSVHSDNPNEPSFDVRADKTGVICPPSRNKTWVRSPDDYSPEPVPEALKKPSGEEAGTVTGGEGRSMLADLLSKPPGKEGTGRNIWMSRVAGHYAKAFPFYDAYDALCAQANSLMGQPLIEDEYRTTINSIWESELLQREARGNTDPELAPSADNGWLMAGNRMLMTPCKQTRGKGENQQTEIVLEEWADFNLVAQGVVEDTSSKRVYDVLVQRHRQGDEIATIIEAATLADERKLAAWLGNFGVTYHTPDTALYKMKPTTRLVRYLESQKPPHFQTVDSLGWHGDGFICQEGTIRADGLKPHERVKPDPRLALDKHAIFQYGFAPEAEARAALREVLTFHDETVCSVFGAWWAATLLKPQIHAFTSLFPFMALEAPSESGKSTGFFRLMLELGGNPNGNVAPTRASLRDALSYNQSGIVWNDDLDDPQHLYELIRQATGEGSVSKKAENRTTTVTVKLVAPICISGEALNLGGQKALIDRAIQLTVPSPTGRMSRYDPTRPQWGDVKAFHRKQGGDGSLTKYAGTLVQMALRHADEVDRIADLTTGGGRFADKIAVLRFGAYVLGALTGDEDHERRVDAWCATLHDTGSQNALTLKLIPRALRQLGFIASPELSNERSWSHSPVLVRDGIVWVDVRELANWWESIRHGRIELRTESAEALTMQGLALGINKNKRRFQPTGDRNRKFTYWPLSQEMSAEVLAEAQGVTDDGPEDEQMTL